jgi:signal transduction histidine kinase
VGVGLWLGFAESGIAYLKEGQVRASYAGAEGLGKGRVGDLQFDRQGALWAATEGGLSRIKNGRVATLTARNGLPCDTVQWVMEDDDGSFWLYMACGLVRIARPELDAWAADPKRTVRAGVYGSSDGVGGRSQATDYSPRVAKTADGKLWFATLDGVSVLDPHNLHLNKLPPPVHIEQITADRKTYPVTPNMHLPPLIRDVWIDYTALSLVAPEKVRFRYKLEGQDTDWKEVVNDRQAQYSNLPPRHYRFRVVASNNSGVWNETGDTLDFSIDPAWFQTRTFYASCVAAGLLALWGVYRLRIWQIKREFNMRMDERVEERTRIARELHDTLLQSFQGTSMLFQVALNLLPADSAKAAQILERALEQAGRAITEGRDAIRGMRSSTEVTNDLAEAMRGLGAEMASDGSPEFRVLVEGPPKELHPILRDEIYKLAREALRNAFRHAQARRIEVGITYGDRLLRVCMRDDGRGIDPAIAETGLSGHYGLPGMRERAQRIGAQFNIWTEPGAGTEIGLSIPAAIAYRTGPEGKVRRLFRRNAG